MATYTETFNQADSSTVGPDQSWTEVAGDWETVSNTLQTGSGGAKIALDGALDTASQYAQCEVTALDAGTTVWVGMGLRVDPSNNNEGLYFIITGDDALVYRMLYWSGSGFSDIASTVSGTAPTAPFTMRAEIGGDGVFRGYFNGSEVISGTPGTPVADHRNVGFYWGGGAVDGAAAIDDFIAGDLVSDTIDIDSVSQYQTFQRNGSDEATVTISGTYVGIISTVEYQIDAGAWTELDGSPSLGAFSGTVTLPAGESSVSVRWSNDTGVTDTVSNIRVGDVFAWIGQSNQAPQFTNSQSYTATEPSSVFDTDDVWENLTTGYGGGSYSILPLVASYIADDQSVPTAFIYEAEGGTGLGSGDPDWASGGTNYDAFVTRYNDSGANGLAGIFWYQGERDQSIGTPQAEYQTALSDLVDRLHTDLGVSCPMVVAMIASINGATAANLTAIRLAQVNRWENDSDIYPGPTGHDQAFGDGTHWKTDAEAGVLSGRWWRAIDAALYGGSEDPRGPRFLSAEFAGAVVTVELTGGVTPIAGGTDTTGWQVDDNGVGATVSSVSITGRTVTITCSSSLSGPVRVRYAYGDTASGTTTVDGGSEPMPIEPIDYLISSAGNYTGIGFALSGGFTIGI